MGIFLTKTHFCKNQAHGGGVCGLGLGREKGRSLASLFQTQSSAHRPRLTEVNSLSERVWSLGVTFTNCLQGDRGSCCGSDAFYRQYTRAVVIDLPFQQQYALRTLAGSLLKPHRIGHCRICKPQRNNDLAALPVPTKSDDRDTFLEEAAVGEELGH